MELESTEFSKLFPNISLTKYDNKKLSWWLTSEPAEYIYIKLTVLWKIFSILNLTQKIPENLTEIEVSEKTYS